MRSGSVAVAMVLATIALPVAAEPWVAGWTTSPVRSPPEQQLTEAQSRDTTVRQIVRVTIGGRALRVRFSNRFGTTPLRIAGAHIALAAGPAAAAIRPGTDRPLTFAGRATVEVPPALISGPIRCQFR
ncbi:hypothetical protein [Sphingomonas hankookensis]|uniref:hypothetical protein n=1 Tax=Sphingomonas hankookensis TaxID=563996 RepID=UPI003F78EF43